MNENIKTVSSQIKRVAISYILIYFHINIATLDILPDWVGYLMIIAALPVLSKKEKSATLLKPLGIFLTIWEVIEWVFAILGGSISIYIINVIIGILHMYFHFQLITNIAEFAPKENRKKRLLVLRAATVIFHTATLVILLFPDIQYAAFATAIAQLVICIWICIELFSLASAVKQEEEMLCDEVMQEDNGRVNNDIPTLSHES